jgi:hypothetical protein
MRFGQRKGSTRLAFDGRLQPTVPDFRACEAREQVRYEPHDAKFHGNRGADAGDALGHFMYQRHAGQVELQVIVEDQLYDAKSRALVKDLLVECSAPVHGFRPGCESLGELFNVGQDLLCADFGCNAHEHAPNWAGAVRLRVPIDIS